MLACGQSEMTSGLGQPADMTSLYTHSVNSTQAPTNKAEAPGTATMSASRRLSPPLAACHRLSSLSHCILALCSLSPLTSCHILCHLSPTLVTYRHIALSLAAPSFFRQSPLLASSRCLFPPLITSCHLTPSFATSRVISCHLSLFLAAMQPHTTCCHLSLHGII